MQNLMTQAYQSVVDNVNRLFPTKLYLLYMIGAVLFLLLWKKNKTARFTALYTLIMILLFFFPVTELLVGSFMRHGFVYWRFFWLVPYPIVIAAACVELLMSIQKNVPRIVVGAALVALLALGGKSIYSENVYQKPVNTSKLPEIVETSISVMHQNAQKTGDNDIRCTGSQEILNKVRQVDSSIYLYPSKRIWLPIREDSKSTGDDLVRILQGAQDPDSELIKKTVHQFAINYVVVPTEMGFASYFRKAGLKAIYSRDGWEIWYCPNIGKPVEIPR